MVHTADATRQDSFVSFASLHYVTPPTRTRQQDSLVLSCRCRRCELSPNEGFIVFVLVVSVLAAIWRNKE